MSEPQTPKSRPGRYAKGPNASLAVNSFVLAQLRAASAPSAVECRAMLITMRKTLRLTRGQMAAILGAPYETFRRWEDGKREPATIVRHRINDVFRSFQRQIARQPHNGQKSPV